jgi:hypothetical protein
MYVCTAANSAATNTAVVTLTTFATTVGVLDKLRHFPASAGADAVP